MWTENNACQIPKKVTSFSPFLKNLEKQGLHQGGWAKNVAVINIGNRDSNTRDKGIPRIKI